MCNIIDDIDARYADETIVKPEKIEKVILIQDIEDLNSLYGIAIIKKEKAILIQSGNINLNSTHKGRIALQVFRDWLDKNNITNRELKFAKPKAYESIKSIGQVLESDFTEEENKSIKTIFDNWATGKEKWV